MQITDDTRIRSTLPTINRAVDEGAKVILCSHLGRPKGVFDPKYSLAPVAKRLGRLLGKDVIFAPDCIGPAVEKLVAKMKDGDVLLLENLRFHTGEEKNDDVFAKALASLGDVFINDAFGAAHRAHASTVGITKYIKDAAAGALLKKERAMVCRCRRIASVYHELPGNSAGGRNHFPARWPAEICRV